MTVKHFFLNFFFFWGGGSKCVTKWQFLLIMRAKEMFNLGFKRSLLSLLKVGFTLLKIKLIEKFKLKIKLAETKI